MILVLLGTNSFCFERLIEAVDRYAYKTGKEVLIQLGLSKYLPDHAAYFRFQSHKEIIKLIQRAELVVTQGGYGSIYDCLEQKKKVIAVPRKRDMKESSDSGLGQIELVQYLEKQKRILVLYDVSKMEEVINEASRFKPNFNYSNKLVGEVFEILAHTRSKRDKSKGINIYRNMFPLLFKNRIIEMTLFVTDICNFKCKHCFMLDKLNVKKTDFLTSKEYEFMGKHIHSMQRVYIGGGEPLTRNDISDIALTLSNQWNAQVVTLPTNGSFQKNAETIAEVFGRKGKHHLRFHFSLSVIGEMMTDFTGRKQAFQLWESTVKSIKEKTRKLKNVSFIVLSTFNDFNQKSIDKFIHYVTHEIAPDDFSLCLVRSHKNYKPNIDLEKFISVNHQLHCESRTYNPFLRAYRESIRDKIAQYDKNPCYHVKCNSGTLRVVMSPDGDVYPCETLGYPEGSKQEDWNMGNIREYDYNIHKLLKGEKAKSIRKKIKDNKCHCQHGIDMSINYLCTWKFRAEVLLLGIKYFFNMRSVKMEQAQNKTHSTSTIPIK